ncbi:MAG: tetratricopeptide repeat protein [Bryobacterales bacterium]|nr:tetratricopeptide repeat protein [Bryobacterales bacterium]
MAEGRFADAAGLYEDLTKRIPGNAGLLMNLGMARHLAGEDAAAIGPLEAALKLQPIPPAMLFLGASYLRTGQPAKAIPPLRRFAIADPNHKEARQMLSDACMATGNFSEAVIHLRELAEWDAAQPGVWYSLGRAYQGIAAGHFAGIPEDSGYWLALAADSRNKQSQTRAGFLLYRKAVEKLPRHRGLHAALAEIYQSAGQAEWAGIERKAEAALGSPVCKPLPTLECHFAAARHQQVLASPSSSAEARYWKARSADALSRDAFTKLMALPPSMQSLRFQAESHRDEGRHKEAVEQWRAALELAPGDPSLEYELAIGLAQIKDFDAAQQIVTKLLAADANAVDLNFLQGDILLNTQQPEKAIVFLETAVAQDPNVLPARASLGRALVLSNRAAEAVPHLEASLAADTDGGLHFQLARAYQAAGKAELARRTLEKYQAILKKVNEDKQKIDAESRISAPPVPSPAAPGQASPPPGAAPRPKATPRRP